MGHEFPGYRFTQRLYASARSTVDRAVRLLDGATVIVKQPADEVVAAEGFRRIQDEHTVLRALRGAGVVDVLGLIRDGSHSALVLEDLGDVLARRIAMQRIAVGDALDIAIEITRSLARIHALGVVHKDINPNNIAYDPGSGTVVIIDFDLAFRIGASAPASTALVEGTLHYLAPEQTGRLNRPIDVRSDLYSLGITLYELFTGRRPFTGDDALALVHAHLAEEPRRIDAIDAIDPGIPSVVGDIVAKLIAKAPERRYQTAAGVQADLERCRRELAADGQIPAFSIGRYDAAPRFELPERLYGREAEVQVLLEAFDRIAQGASEAALISGSSGIGKSALVHEVDRRLSGRGYFAWGKFEQLNRDAPYRAIVRVLDGLIAQVLAEATIDERSDEIGRGENAPRGIDRWRAEIAAAIGDSSALVRSVVPSLERVLGPLLPAPSVDSDVARHRLGQAMARLVQVFARKRHPLVMFLDDVQWGDTASLLLLTELVTSDQTEALLVIEAFRDAEIDDAHPAFAAIRTLERRDARISRIALSPLTVDETVELVADALRQPPEAVAAPAAVIWRKTSGNPLFVRRFLHALHEDGFLAAGPGANGFTLDSAALDRAAITENVADFLAHQIGRLPEATRAALVAAAALGTQFDDAMLARVVAIPAGELRAVLAPAIEAGLVVAARPRVHADAAIEILGTRYRFQHDRIQQAAYETAPVEVRDRLHLTIGRQVLLATAPGELDERLFEIVHHLGRGLALIEPGAERARFVELASDAARRARRSGAFDVAQTLLRSICAICDWHAHHDQAFAARFALAEVLSLGGLQHAARDIIRAANQHALPRERAALDALESRVCSRLGLMTEALVHGRRAARLLGVELPIDPAQVARDLDAELGAVMAAIAARPVEQWIDLPVMTEPDKLAAMALLCDCIIAAYQNEPPLMVLICAKMVTLSLRHGNCGESARAYVSLAITMWMIGNYDVAFELGKLAVDLVRRIDASAFAPAVDVAFAAFVSPWRNPVTDSVERLRAAVTGAIEVGDIASAGYASLMTITYKSIEGASLDEMLAEGRQASRRCTQLGVDELQPMLGWYIYHARWWTGAVALPGEIELDFVATETTLEVSPGSRSHLAGFRILELERRYWSGDVAGAIELARKLAATLNYFPALGHNAEYRLYACLAAIAMEGAGADLAAFRADLARYAELCPVNYRHMSALVEAECARVGGDAATAIAMYDAAIDAAAAHGFVKGEVLAHEHAARFWIDRGKQAFGTVHLAKARDLCEHWGARPRARELEIARRKLGATGDVLTRTLSTSAFASTLDFATVVKASHAIASDMVLDSLLAKMMEIIVENTGAQAGAIVLAAGGALSLHASKQPGTPISVSGGVALADAHEVPAGIVKYVARTAESVVLGDATRHPIFRTDPYVRERRPRSVLCLPIVHKEQLIGVVYLENNLVADAFTVERLDALGILVAQLAISIENAMMFSRLEELVARRTHALTEANQQLREQALVRERMESELRLAQRLQSVGQLAAGVAHEINTPMQYIADNISFLDDALGALFAIVAAYRSAIDPVTGRADVAAMDEADRQLDLEYLRGNAPEACAQARDGVARVSRIVGAMRVFSHPDPDPQAPTSLRTALENTLVVAHNAYRDVADIVTEFADLPDVVCHPGEINQVFLNLLVNGAHAIEDVVRAGGPRGTIAIRTWREDAETVVVAISDTGGGIPDTIRDRVFDPFFTTKEIGRGTGQGLSLARTAIVNRHGGTIEFVTRPGEGTTFFVRLPIRGRQASRASITARGQGPMRPVR